MGSNRKRWPLAALVLLVSACASAPTAGPSPSPAAPRPSPDGLTQAEMEAVYRERQIEGRSRFSAADVRFMQGMIHHHAQALEMSRLVPERTTTGSIRTLAARIINAQRDEIALMQRWLRERDQPVPEVHVTDDGVMVHGEGHMMNMPGMIPPTEIRALAELSGAAFDRRFLELMIRHHSGAVEMVRALFATDGALQDEDAFRFASDVQVDQVTEVNRMERMLEVLGSGSPQ